MVTPLPRRRPHKLVREIVSIDHLSGGRLVLGVGIGALPFEWDYLGEESSPSVRGEMLDEGLEVLAALMTGRPLLHRGTHYTIDGELPGETRGAQFLPASLQSPRVPIWVAATWPKKRPFRRSAKWDGVVAMKAEGALSVEDVAEIRSYVGTNRKESEPFDFALSGTTARDDVDKLRAYERAGATWWLESIDPWRFGWNGTGIWPTSEMRRRVLDGPPRA
jgi:alkanesulfonate monooxygenase SsuD/methylene tetrahydromethanopterin reductase-like flavin-dependent oxidoreductase (luciferase family)